MLECKDTEKLTWEEVKEYAEDIVTIKGHDIALCDCGRFGYCALVFKNHAHLYCADQLHGDCRYYKELDNTVLAGKYLKSLQNTIFTEAELLEDIRDHADYKAKDYYLRNIWVQQFPHQTMFCMEGEQVDIERYPFFNKICFCYMSDESAVNRAVELSKSLEKKHKTFLLSDLVHFRKAISRELADHEACVSGEFEESVEALGLKWDQLSGEQQDIVLKELHRQEMACF